MRTVDQVQYKEVGEWQRWLNVVLPSCLENLVAPARANATLSAFGFAAQSGGIGGGKEAARMSNSIHEKFEEF